MPKRLVKTVRTGHSGPTGCLESLKSPLVQGQKPRMPVKSHAIWPKEPKGVPGEPERPDNLAKRHSRRDRTPTGSPARRPEYLQKPCYLAKISVQSHAKALLDAQTSGTKRENGTIWPKDPDAPGHAQGVALQRPEIYVETVRTAQSAQKAFLEGLNDQWINSHTPRMPAKIMLPCQKSQKVSLARRRSWRT